MSTRVRNEVEKKERVRRNIYTHVRDAHECMSILMNQAVGSGYTRENRSGKVLIGPGGQYIQS